MERSPESRPGYAGNGSVNVRDLHPAAGRLSGSLQERIYAVRSLCDRTSRVACPAPVQRDYRGHIERVVARRWSEDGPASGYVINIADSGTK